jgi:cyclase
VLKKRIIFTLLYDSGYFMLSRNFRLQRVGDLNWLKENYNFARIAFYIDELLVLDVSRQGKGSPAFYENLKDLAKGCFVPIAAGGGVTTIDTAKSLLRYGADKVVVNTALFSQPRLVHELVSEFGRQCIVGSVDIKKDVNGEYQVFVSNGSQQVATSASAALSKISIASIGELYLNSIDRDGTGQGFDFDTLELITSDYSVPIILAGGAGNGNHLLEGIKNSRINAVATAHLFNFVGDGLEKARALVKKGGVSLAEWPNSDAIATEK